MDGRGKVGVCGGVLLLLVAAAGLPVSTVASVPEPVRLLVDRPIVEAGPMGTGLHETFVNVYFSGGDPSVTAVSVVAEYSAECVMAVGVGTLQRRAGDAESSYFSSRLSFRRTGFAGNHCWDTSDGTWRNGFADETGLHEAPAIRYRVVEHDGSGPIDAAGASIILRGVAIPGTGATLGRPAAPPLILPGDGSGPVPDDGDTPSITALSVNAGAPWTNSRSVPVSITVEDTTGIERLGISWNTGCSDVRTSELPGGPVHQHSFSITLPATDASYAVCARVSDGLRFSDTVTAPAVGLDMTRPVVYTSRVGRPHVAGSPAAYILPTTQLRAAVAEDFSGLSACTVAVDGPDTAYAAMQCGVGDTNFNLASLLGSVPDGDFTVATVATDRATNTANHALQVRVDGTGPVLGDCEGGLFGRNTGLHAVRVLASDAGVGLDAAGSSLTATVDTSAVGPQTVEFVGIDLLGNRTTKVCTYSLLSAELTSPVDAPPVINRAKAGRVMPVKLELTTGSARITGGINVQLRLQRFSACAAGTADGVEFYAPSTAANDDGLFRWDVESSHWVLNLEVPQTGCYHAQVVADGVSAGFFWLESVK